MLGSELRHVLLDALPTWWTILRISSKSGWSTGAISPSGTLMRFLPIVTQIFLWGAVFDRSAAGCATGRRSPATRTATSSPTTC